MADTVDLVTMYPNDEARARVASALALGHRVMVRTTDITSSLFCVSVVATAERYGARECPLCHAQTPGNLDGCVECEQDIGFGAPLVEVDPRSAVRS